jgi:hypothetical protein
MSVSLLLAEYPQAILQSEIYVVLLTVLERRGSCAEDELAMDTHLELPAIGAAVVVLHKNQLIDIVRGLIQISRRGKMLLDRLKLQLDIVEDVLDQTLPPISKRNELRSLLFGYRENAFPRYLSCLHTLNTWKFVEVRSGPELKKNTATKYRAQGAKIALLTLLLRDLIDWTSRQSSGVEGESPYSAIVQKLTEPAPDVSYEWAAANECVSYLRPGHSAVGRKLGATFRSEFKGYLEALIDFDVVQDRCGEDLWPSLWVDMKHSSATGKNLWTELHRFVDFYSSAVNRIGLEMGKETRTEDVHLSGRGDIILALLNANTLADFAQTIGLPTSAATVLLVTLKDKSTRLLATIEQSDPEINAQTSKEPHRDR